MVYFIFTVDGDWREYFNIKLCENKRLPKLKVMRGLIQREINTAGRLLKGRFVHFIHTSPRARDFFLKEPFIRLWRRILEKGGDIGVHCHEDDPYKAYYSGIDRLRSVIAGQVRALRKLGLKPSAYRGGFLSYSKGLTSVLRENNLCFDFSCEPGRYLVDAASIVADWRGSPESLYQMSVKDYKKAGNSGVYEVPLGVFNKGCLYFEKAGFKEIEQVGLGLQEKSAGESRDIVVAALAHSYDYSSLAGIKSIEKKLSILKRYGRFINLAELREIIDP